VDELHGIPGPGPVYHNDNSSGFVIIKELRPPEPKQLDEARGQVVSDYQTYLEEQWIRKLREKYPVRVNRELLR
jgi:peptidyl-prolyl cis-trans isomerase SurA